jgi:hypothetical protein
VGDYFRDDSFILIAARLYSPTALVNVSKWAGESGADLLWGIPAEKLTDDRLGKAIDAFYSQRHSILASFAMHVSAKLGVPICEVHYDPTHLLFHGAYEESEAREVQPADATIATNDNLPPANITKGRRMEDAAHGGQMVHVGLCTHVDEFGPLPIFGHTVGGNINGRTAVAEQFAIIKKHLKPPKLTMVSDRGTYSPLHLARLINEGFHAICSAPWNDFQTVYDEFVEKLKWKEASYLSQEQERRRTEGSLPH